MQLQWCKFVAAVYFLIKPTILTKKLSPMILETIIENYYCWFTLIEKNGFESNNSVLKAIIEFF